MPHETQPDQIASDAQTTLDEIRRLQADRAHRDARRMFFVEGVRNVVHAIESGFQIETLLYSEKLLIVPIARRLIRERRRTGVPTIEVSPESFRQISLTPSCLRRGGRRRPEVVLPPPRFPEGRALLGTPRGHPIGRQPREPDPDLGGRRWGWFHPDGSADRPLLPHGRPRVDGGCLSSVVHSDERPKPQELGPSPPLSRRRRGARWLGRPPSLRLSPADAPRPGRGAPGIESTPTWPLHELRAHSHGRIGRFVEPRRGGQPADVRGLSHQVGSSRQAASAAPQWAGT